MKLNLGFRMKLVLSAGTILTLVTLAAQTTLQAINAGKATDLDRLVELLKKNPSLKSAINGDLLDSSGFRVWERTGPQDDGLPYLEAIESYPSSRLEFRREASSTPAPTNDTQPASAPAPEIPPNSTKIAFRNFGCNILPPYWICSHRNSPFCVYFNTTVPASTELIVVPFTNPPVVTKPSEVQLQSHRCKNRVPVRFQSSASGF